MWFHTICVRTMKKCWFVLGVCPLLPVVAVARAGTGSGEPDDVLAASGRTLVAAEKNFKRYGMDCKAGLYYGADVRAAVCRYRFSEKSVYKQYTRPEAKAEVRRGLASTLIQNAPSGRRLRELVAELERVGCNIAVEAVLPGRKKEKTARGALTAADLAGALVR